MENLGQQETTNFVTSYLIIQICQFIHKYLQIYKIDPKSGINQIDICSQDHTPETIEISK